MTSASTSVAPVTYAAGEPSWTDLMTPTLEPTKAFYAALFGWEYSQSGEEYGHYAMANVNGDSAAGIVPMPQGANFPSAWTVYFASDDVVVDAARVRALGGGVIMEPMQVSDLGHMGVFTDPTGAVFGLWQAGDHKGAQARKGQNGSLSWVSLNTRDSGAALAFYQAFLRAGSDVMGADYHLLKHGDAAFAGLYGMHETDGTPTPAWMQDVPSHWMPYFNVPDLDRAVGVVERGGGRVLEAPMDTPFGRMVVVADPAGAVLTLAQTQGH